MRNYSMLFQHLASQSCTHIGSVFLSLRNLSIKMNKPSVSTKNKVQNLDLPLSFQNQRISDLNIRPHRLQSST